MNKILVSIFVVLLIIIAGEVVYYFYFIPSPQPIPQTTQVQNSQNPIQPSPTSPTPTNQPQSLKPREFLTKVEEFLAEHEKGAMTSSVLINQYAGKITNIEKRRPLKEPDPKSEYSLFISIQGTNSTENSIIKIRDLAIPETNIVKKTGEKEIPIQISDLKTGDSIIVTENYPLTKKSPDDKLKYTIIKISP